MSDFEVLVKQVVIEPHDNADSLELARIDGYVSCVRKGQFSSGDLVAYIPEYSIVPTELLQEMGLEGKLAGSQKNVVRPVKLRGVLSQGIVYPAREGWQDGDDVAQVLGIQKYEPPIPIHLYGEQCNARDATLKFDIENWKKHTRVIPDGEQVVFTEKIHGTFAQFGYNEAAKEGPWVVTSKGLAARGVAIRFCEENESNLYIRTFRKMEDKLQKLVDRFSPEPVYMLGEIFGRGVQDLTYGQNETAFRMFDIYVGRPGSGRFLNYMEMMTVAETLLIETVPMLYMGPFDVETLKRITNGKTFIGDNKQQIREGLVIRPLVERSDRRLGRVILKSVSEDYLLRKNGTEYN